jgi:hypothetical protein
LSGAVPPQTAQALSRSGAFLAIAAEKPDKLFSCLAALVTDDSLFATAAGAFMHSKFPKPDHVHWEFVKSTVQHDRSRRPLARRVMLELPSPGGPTFGPRMVCTEGGTIGFKDFWHRD